MRLTNFPLPLTLLPLAIAQDTVTILTATLTADADTTIVSTVTAPLASPTLSDTYSDSTLFREQILNSTNYARYLHSAPFLSWNSTIASFAQSYASECIWAHNPARTTYNYGENLARGYANASASVLAWYDEVFNPGYDFSQSDPTGFTEGTGHFSQLVWRGSVDVGCGWRDCNGENGVQGVIVVCDYYPAGNVLWGSGGSGGDGEDRLFVQNVLPEREGGAEGFDEEAASEGVRTDVPVPAGEGGTGDGGNGGNGGNGEEGGAESINIRQAKVGVVVGIVLGFVAFVL
jgi:hypothetical protein